MKFILMEWYWASWSCAWGLCEGFFCVSLWQFLFCTHASCSGRSSLSSPGTSCSTTDKEMTCHLYGKACVPPFSQHWRIFSCNGCRQIGYSYFHLDSQLCFPAILLLGNMLSNLQSDNQHLHSHLSFPMSLLHDNWSLQSGNPLCYWVSLAFRSVFFGPHVPI